MAKNLKLSNAAANAALDALCALLNGGTLKLYTGTQPATPNTALTDQVLLATLTFGAPAFGAAVDGVATANAITKDSDADFTGAATWFRAASSAGAAEVDGSVGTSGCDVNMATVSVVQHAEISITSMQITMPKSA
jgi:hypothetical protein